MRLVTVLGFALGFAAASPADAAIYVVNSTADAVDAAINGTCAAAGGACTLRAAIQEANAVTNADTIQLPAGTYTLMIAGDDALAAVGDLDIRNPVAIEGAGAGVTTVDAAGIDRVFEIPFSPSTFQVAIDAVTIRGGATTNSGGGGIAHSDDGTLLLSSVTLTDNHVAGITSNAVGGAIDVNGGGTATLQECLLWDNSADRGGAIFTNSTLTLLDSTITGNLARVGSAFESYGTTTVVGTTIWDNESTGGAVVDVAQDQTILWNSTLTLNTPAGALVLVSGADALDIGRSTLFDNAAFGTIRVVSGVVEAIGSVIAGSIGTQECSTDGTGTFGLLDYNLDDDGSCVPTATGITAADPLLGALADNGGPTLTRAPLAGSPLIDAAEASPLCTGVDQRGFPRPADGGGPPEARCDIGAVELAPEPAGVAHGVAALLALAALGRRRS